MKYKIAVVLILIQALIFFYMFSINPLNGNYMTHIGVYSASIQKQYDEQFIQIVTPPFYHQSGRNLTIFSQIMLWKNQNHQNIYCIVIHIGKLGQSSMIYTAVIKNIQFEIKTIVMHQNDVVRQIIPIYIDRKYLIDNKNNLQIKLYGYNDNIQVQIPKHYINGILKY